MATTTSITKVLLFDTDTDATLVANVLAADATATTFLLNCPPGTDSNDCGTYDESVVVGPWAKPTPPPDASTGVYDLEVNLGTEWFFHLHCDVSQTVPVDCTTTNLGGNDDGSPTATFASVASNDDSLGWNYVPITITSGLEKLASATASAGAGSEVTSGASVSSATATTTVSGAGSSTGSSTASGTSNTASATGTNSAAFGRGQPFAGTFALVGLVLAWITR